MSIEINRSIHRKYCLAQERYLIDGDLDLILRRPVPRLKHLYRLKVYCMENRLLSEFAAVAIGTECATDIGWHDMALRLSFRALMEAPVQKLLPLFIVYSVVQKLGLTIETVGYPVQRLLKVPSDPETLSGHLVRKRMRELISGIQFRTSSTKYGRMRDSIWNGVAAHAGRLGSFLSRKDYLLPLVHLKLRRVANFAEFPEKLKVRLAQHCELTIDPGLRRAILRALKGK